MSADAEKAKLDDAIVVDEIGIESGAYGIYRLRCLYQPIFERRGKSLHMVAVEGVVAPYVAGEDVPEEVFLAAAADDDLAFIGRMSLVLPLRNHRNIGHDGLELVVRADADMPTDVLDCLRVVAGELSEAELDPALVFFTVGEPTASDSPLLARLAEQTRSLGMRVGVGDFGAGRWTDGQMETLQPAIVRIDGDWFRKVCRDAVTVRLFDSVVARLHERRSKVLVTGIESEQQFGVALRAGTDLFQGKHLAPPTHVGTTFKETMLLRNKIGNAEKIVPLYG